MDTTRPDRRVIDLADAAEHRILPQLTDRFGDYFGTIRPANVSIETANLVANLEKRIEHALTVITYATEVQRRAEWEKHQAEKGVA